ncbi:MAG TPA: ParA family protein [Flavipsychrobacter sp.]
MFITSLYNLKGGVGKTASCVNFAHMAARDGYKVLLWDLDPQGAASFYYNAQPKEKVTAKKIIEHTLDLEEAIMSTPYEWLDIIPADLSARKLDLLLDDKSSKKQIRNLLKTVADTYDFVFIDCPPGFSSLADNIFFASDAVLMPVIPTTLSIRTYEIVKHYFEEKGDVEKLMCFFTMVDIRKNMHKDVMQQLYKDKRFFEYYIPYLSDVEKMGVHHAPLETFAPSSYAATCYRALWNEIKEGVLE